MRWFKQLETDLGPRLSAVSALPVWSVNLLLMVAFSLTEVNLGCLLMLSSSSGAKEPPYAVAGTRGCMGGGISPHH